MGVFRKIGDGFLLGVGGSAGLKAGEAGMSLGGKVARTVTGFGMLFVVTGGMRTCATEPGLARDALQGNGGPYATRTLGYAWEHATLAFQGGYYLFNKVAGDGRGDTYEMRRVKPADCPERIRRMESEGYNPNNPEHQLTVEQC